MVKASKGGKTCEDAPIAPPNPTKWQTIVSKRRGEFEGLLRIIGEMAVTRDFAMQQTIEWQKQQLETVGVEMFRENLRVKQKAKRTIEDLRKRGRQQEEEEEEVAGL